MKKILAFLSLSILFLNGIAQNQNALMAEWGNGTYTVYKNEDGKLNKTSKPWPVEMKMGAAKDFDGNTQLDAVVISRQGVIKEEFKADIPENPVYFGFKDFRISVFGDKMYYYTYTPGNAEIYFILTKGGGVDNIKREKEVLQDYVKAAFEKQASAKGKVQEIKKANEQKLIAESSLKDKKIKKIEIVMLDVPKELGMRSIVKFGIKATAEDGKVYSTPNLGGYTPWSDFEVKTSDGVYTDDQIQVHDDASKLVNDQLSFKVTSKYHPNISASETFPLNYAFKTLNFAFINKEGKEIYYRNAGIFQDYNYKGADGSNLDIKVQKSTLKGQSTPIYKIEIVNANDGKVLERLKVSENTVVNISASGIYGRDGYKASRSDKPAENGAKGGDGGNVTIYKAPNASSVLLNVKSDGGRGGQGGKGSYSGLNGSPGPDGKPGYIQEKTLSGNLTW